MNINVEIAKMLGFRAYKIGDKDAAWKYPCRFRRQLVSMPERVLPDFLSVIISAMELFNAAGVSASIRKDFDTHAIKYLDKKQELTPNDDQSMRGGRIYE